MKIVQIDFYNRESEVLIAENVHTQFGESIVQFLNQNPIFGYRYVLKFDSYKLLQR